MGATVVDIQRLLQHGVDFHSFTEEHFCTDNERACGVLLPVIHSLAGAERRWLSEQIKAGLERARAKGKRLGRAPFSRAQQQSAAPCARHGSELASDQSDGLVSWTVNHQDAAPPRRRMDAYGRSPYQHYDAA
jgi:DNA invertase Pin-like site-specific DNA recombinase